MVHCEKCGWQPIPESELPLRLPEITDFEPGPDGESPLARHTECRGFLDIHSRILHVAFDVSLSI